MTIACLGWGSLVWDPRELPVNGAWQDDGPALPLEFARRSGGERITLVIVDGGEPSVSKWAELTSPSLAEAVEALRQREGKTPAKNIGRWPTPDGMMFSQADTIGTWAKAKGLSGVVWTALPPGLGRPPDGNFPPLEAVLAHIQSLEGKAHEDAAEYVFRAPAQVRTRYRPALEAELSNRQAPVWDSFFLNSSEAKARGS